MNIEISCYQKLLENSKLSSYSASIFPLPIKSTIEARDRGKKIKKPIKSWKPNSEKKLKKLIRILKKSTGLVRFYKPGTEKTKPNLNRKKPSQTEKTEPNRKNQTEKNLVKSKKPSQIGLNRFLF